MTEFIIDTPSHKCWWLPDGRHQLNSVLYGTQFRLSIIDSWSGRSFKTMYVDIKPDDSHNDLLIGYQEFANKHYPKPLRAKRLTQTDGKSHGHR